MRSWRYASLHIVMPESRRTRAGKGEARERAKPGDPKPGRNPRYTPPAAKFRVRPRWHRLAGWSGVALGVGIAAMNDVMLFGDVTLLPGGHSELYLFAAVAVGGGSTWFLGLFDRGTTIYD